MITLPSARRIATPTELGFSVMFGLRPAVAAILAEMFEGGEVLSSRALRTHIYSLRLILTEEAVDTTDGGYALTPIGRAECEKALADFRSWIDGEKAA